MMPATWVPCPSSSYGWVRPLTKSTNADTRWFAVRIQRCRTIRQIVVPCRDARVEDRDADAGAGQPQTALHGARADGQRRAVVVFLDRTVVVNAEDLGMPLELRDRGVRQVEDVAVDDAKPALDAREALELIREFCTRRERHDHAGHVLGAVAFPADNLVVRLVAPDGRAGIGAAGRDRGRREPDQQHQ